MDLRASRLKAFVDKSFGAPVVWGMSDCSAWPATWVGCETGIVIELPMYTSQEEAMQLVSGSGLVSLWEQAISGRLLRTDSPVLGDVGIVRFRAGDIGVIFADDGIALYRGETKDGAAVRGIKPTKQTLLAAWTV